MVLKGDLKRPDVFIYQDYRKFLGDFFAYLKKESKFAITKLAQQAGIAAGYLPMVVKGKCKLSEKALEKILPHLPLTNPEKDFLRSLCILVDSESSQEKIVAIETIQRMSHYRKMNPKEVEVFRYLSNWHYVAIREMAALPDFKLDAEWIQKRLGQKNITLIEIQRAIDFLLDAGFLQKDERGKIHPPDKTLQCMDEIHKTALIEFYRQIFSLTLEASYTVPPELRSVTGYTFAIPASKFKEVKKLLEETLKKSIELSKKREKADTVFQIGLLGIPLSRIPND